MLAAIVNTNYYVEFNGVHLFAISRSVVLRVNEP